MTVENQIPLQSFTANGTDKLFAFDFYVNDKSNFVVYINNQLVDASQYTYNKSTNAITFNTAPAVNSTIVIKRVTPLQRDQVYRSDDNSFNPINLNYDFDQLWRVLQEQGVNNTIAMTELINLLDQLSDADRAILNKLIEQTKENIATDTTVVSLIDREVGQRIDQDKIYNALSQMQMDNKAQELKAYFNALLALEELPPDYWDGVSTKAVFEDNNQTQHSINLNGGVKWYNKAGGYNKNERAVLEDGSIVISTENNNTNNPNINKDNWTVTNNGYEILTLEMFGGKNADVDPTFDNSDAFDKLFKSYYALHGITSGITFQQLEQAVQVSKRVVIKLNGLYRITRPINLPPNTTWLQAADGYFAKAPNMGIFYDGDELNTYALGGVLYKKQPDLTYTLDTDVMTLVTGAQFDNGEYFMAAVRQHLINPHVLTRRGTTLAYRFMGWAGNYASHLSCGENNGVYSRVPKVAFLTGSCWGARIDHPNTLSLHQGHVHKEAGGGFSVNDGYINSSLLDEGLNRNDVIVTYKPDSLTESGTIGLTLLGECYHHNVVAENWSIGHVSTHQFHIFRPHMERIDKYAHYLINCEGIIDFKGVTPVEALSVIYLKDYRDFNREVKIRGTFAMGGNLVLGENSDPSLVLDIAHSHSFIQYYKWGHVGLVKNIINKWKVDIYVDPINGNDSNVGLRDIRALKSFWNVKRLCELFDSKSVVLLNDIIITEQTNMPNEFNITGNKTLTMKSPFKITNVGSVDIALRNTLVNNSGGGLLFLFDTSYNFGNINIYADVDMPNSTFVQTIGNLNLDVNIQNNKTHFSLLSYCPNYANVILGWNVKSLDYNIPYRFDGGGGSFKYISNALGYIATDVASSTINANTTLSIDVPFKLAKVGDNINITYSSYIAGLSFNAFVVNNGLVRVAIVNTSNANIILPVGKLFTKIV